MQVINIVWFLCAIGALFVSLAPVSVSVCDVIMWDTLLETMAALVKSRVAIKGWVTRSSNRLKLMLAQPQVDLVELQDAVDEFDSHIGRLDSIQSDVEVELDQEVLMKDIDDAADFREKARKPRIEATKLLKDSNRAASVTTSAAGAEAKLPKLNLPKFAGDPLTWSEFWEPFEALVDDTELNDIVKFTYLSSLLEGEAKATVSGLKLTGANYDSAVTQLKDRYGRPQRIISSHIQEMLQLSVPASQGNRVTGLWQFYNQLNAHVRSLETLKVTGTQYGVVLTPLVLSRLPTDLRLEWARVGEDHEDDLEFLLEFLGNEIRRRERSQVIVSQSSPGNFSKSVGDERKKATATAAALYSSSGTQKLHYALCSKSHHTTKCWSLTRGPMEQRWDRVTKSGLCYSCLTKNHTAKACNKGCSKCNGKHHVLLCSAKRPAGNGNSMDNSLDHGRPPPPPPPPERPSSGDHLSSSDRLASHTYLTHDSHDLLDKKVFLQTIQVTVQGRSGVTLANVLFDTGSDRSYISESLVMKIGPEWAGDQHVAYAAFGQKNPSKTKLRNLYQVELMCKDGQYKPLLATEVPFVCAPIYRPSVPERFLRSFRDLSLAGDYKQGERFSVDILLGLDAYWSFVLPQIVPGPDGLVAQNTVFGYILSGCVPGSAGADGVSMSHPLLCFDVSAADMSRLWDLESIGIPEDEDTVDPLLQWFDESVQFQDGRYVVALPWKDDAPRLKNNLKQAGARLERLTQKLSQQPDLECRYSCALEEMETSGVIMEVPPEELDSPHLTYYMPHRPVVKESSSTTKVRPVFDASACGYNGVSLNDCMHTGPQLIPSLVDILIRFRRCFVGLTADIQKAFLQIRVRAQDQDVHRFLLKSDDATRVMRFDRVPFGNRASPFLLNATVRHHLSLFDDSKAVLELRENMYVDNLISGVDDDGEGCSFMREATEVMSKAGMNLTQWCSSSRAVCDMVAQEFDDKLATGSVCKVLGLEWRPQEDCFSFNCLTVSPGLFVTKPVVLSFIARTFDPLGFSAPFIMSAKIMFQQLWRLKLEWDVPAPEDIQAGFLRWCDDLEMLRGWMVPRSFMGYPWCDVMMMELHGFGDASPVAYGACVYLKTQAKDGTWSASLVLAKARVAPLKTQTLPRLELLGALLCSRLVVLVKKALKLPDDVTCVCWSDSTVTLAWIRSDPHRWKPFVANRVAEIQIHVSPSHWLHCRTEFNPADLLTRGLSANELVQSKAWLHGPEFLCEGSYEHILPDSVVEETSESSHDAADAEHVVLLVATGSVCVFPVERWSGLCKAIRVVGWVQRFIHNVRCEKSQRLFDDLNFQELESAKYCLIQSVQAEHYAADIALLRSGKPVAASSKIAKLTPFIDSDGLLRVQGRLQQSTMEYGTKHPIILPKCHLSLLVVRFQHLLQKHAGVVTLLVMLRNHYWIVGARRLAKQVKKDCVACRRIDAPACKQRMAPLPVHRVKQAPVFSTTGIDHAGPLYCCDVNKKFYILLFTCSVVRALHLELVESLNVQETLRAIRRFVSRRGLPSVIWSDNSRHLRRKFRGIMVLQPQSGSSYFLVAHGGEVGGKFWSNQ